jgi:ABC-type lipoprotein export system ATPase subunit
LFLNQNKLEKQSKKEEIEADLKTAETIALAEKRRHKEAREKYESYVSEEAFSKLLEKIELYFKNFNFNFSLELDMERKTGSTKEFPFAFRVLDPEGNERDFKEGLSEGELQVLSLCFFFAFLDIQNEKDTKILVFDDPITSLDNSNLSCLVDLISKERSAFSQALIFTHHKTFFKFLKGKFKKSKSAKFNILRNKKEFGGSFICKSKSEKFLGKLEDFESHLQSIPPGSIDIDLKIVEYGQYLRYEAERFIKNKLLHWNANDFPAAIEGVKGNKMISDECLDDIKSVYTFCNWTTSHIDVGDDHGLNQLKGNIAKFLDAINLG